MKQTLVRTTWASIGVIGVVATALSGCGGGGGGGNPGSPGTKLPLGNFVAPGTTPYTLAGMASRSACAVNAHVNGRARWTVLVYMNAANNLQPFSLVNVAQMASVGTNANLNIVLQWKQSTISKSNFFSSVPIDTTPSFVGTRRYLLKKHSAADLNAIAPANITTSTSAVGNTTSLDADRLPDPATDTISDNGNPTADMGDYHTLLDFVQWGTKTYPADHIALVVWDHGSAALNVINRSALHAGTVPKSQVTTRIASKPTTRGVSQDCTTGNQIATQQIPLALANPAQPIDALVIDCSLQGTAEMAYDARNSARVYIASEESPPGLGYPYDVWLNYIQNNVAGPCDIGSNLITATIAEYPAESDITQSMTDLSKMNAVGAALNSFGSSLAKYATSQSALIYADRQAAQYFEFPEYKDLYDFADNVRRNSTAPADLQAAAGNMETALLGSTGAVLISAHGSATDSTGFSESLACGLSVFLPGPNEPSSVDNTTGFDPAWLSLGLATAAPNWATFLQAQQQ